MIIYIKEIKIVVGTYASLIIVSCSNFETKSFANKIKNNKKTSFALL